MWHATLCDKQGPIQDLGTFDDDVMSKESLQRFLGTRLDVNPKYIYVEEEKCPGPAPVV